VSLVDTLRGIVDTGRISLPTVVDSALGRLDPDACETRLGWWSEKLLRDAEVELRVEGRQNAGDGSEPFVVMSNHQSLYDIPVLFQSVPGKLRMVAKAELFKVPIWGKAMLAAGFVKIDRGDRDRAIESLRAVGGSLLRGGTRVWIAPEGTRSRTGDLGEFKSGGFRMALEVGARILPVAIEGTRYILPAKGAVVQRGRSVDVAILPPIDPAPYGVERRRELMTEVRSRIEAAHRALRERRAA
jgi:1-acyl-sn-glycerol-3-phosphate acyltransferase